MDGILIINKPSGITSHDVVDIIRKKFNIEKVGHAGTLDPLAIGVLVVLLGKATKLSNSFIQDDKEYVATLFLGKSTDTQDRTGRVIEEKKLDNLLYGNSKRSAEAKHESCLAKADGLDIDAVKEVFNIFLGEIEQVPPMVSAKKYKGRKLYELARRGISVKRTACKVMIYEIELLDFKPPEIMFRLRCSKGTYVRTLCEDIGRALGYPAHMSGLVRTRSGRFRLEEACELHKVNEKDVKKIPNYAIGDTFHTWKNGKLGKCPLIEQRIWLQK